MNTITTDSGTDNHYKAPGRVTRSIVNPLVSVLVKLGVPLKGAGVLSVRGRTTGEWRSVPVNPLNFEGDEFLVAPRGETQWAKNMRSAGGGRIRRGRRTQEFTAVEVADAEKTPMLRAYLQEWAWEIGAFFDGVGADSSDEQLAAIAPKHPIFRITAVWHAPVPLRLMLPLRIGAFEPAAPVVLAPMAGVTDAPFRAMCREYAPDLVYVNEMVMATAVVYRNDKTLRMMTFGPDERPRSLQIYGSDPDVLGRAVHTVCEEGMVDHVDLNFGCPAAKVTRRGGGAAVPAKPRLLRAVVRATVRAARPYGVPVTAKFRMGLWDDLRTDVETGLICAEEGVHWIALHARTVEQHYAGEARWDAIAELKRAVDAIPVLGNGDIWEASDAVEMMAATGCDGVVIGRGCLGRPWLFGDLVTVLNGGGAPPPRPLGVALDAMRRHARLLAEHYEPHGGERFAMRDFRKHTNWYMSGYPVGPEVRRRLSQICSLLELDGILDELDPTTEMVVGGERIKRGHSNGPIKVSLPEHFLDDRDELVIPDDNDVMALSGG